MARTKRQKKYERALANIESLATVTVGFLRNRNARRASPQALPVPDDDEAVLAEALRTIKATATIALSRPRKRPSTKPGGEG